MSDGDLLMTLSAWFAVGLVVGVALGLLIAYWVTVSAEREMVCPHCRRPMR